METRRQVRSQTTRSKNEREVVAHPPTPPPTALVRATRSTTELTFEVDVPAVSRGKKRGRAMASELKDDWPSSSGRENNDTPHHDEEDEEEQEEEEQVGQQERTGAIPTQEIERPRRGRSANIQAQMDQRVTRGRNTAVQGDEDEGDAPAPSARRPRSSGAPTSANQKGKEKAVTPKRTPRKISEARKRMEPAPDPEEDEEEEGQLAGETDSSAGSGSATSGAPDATSPHPSAALLFPHPVQTSYDKFVPSQSSSQKKKLRERPVYDDEEEDQEDDFRDDRPDNPARPECFMHAEWKDEEILWVPDCIWLYPKFADDEEREELRHKIEANGGVIVDGLEGANIAIIPRGETLAFNNEVTKATELGVFPVYACWVDDCLLKSHKLRVKYRCDPVNLYRIRPIPPDKERVLLAKKASGEPLRNRREFTDEEKEQFARFVWKWGMRAKYTQGVNISEMIRRFIAKHGSPHNFESWKNFYKPGHYREEIDKRVKEFNREHRGKTGGTLPELWGRGESEDEDARPSTAKKRTNPTPSKSTPESKQRAATIESDRPVASTSRSHTKTRARSLSLVPDGEEDEDEAEAEVPATARAPASRRSSAPPATDPSATQLGRKLLALSEKHSLPLDTVEAFWWSSTLNHDLFERVLKEFVKGGRTLDHLGQDDVGLTSRLWVRWQDRALMKGQRIEGKDERECKKRTEFLALFEGVEHKPMYYNEVEG